MEGARSCLERWAQEGPRGGRFARSTLSSQGRSHFDRRGSAAHNNKMVVAAATDFNSLSCHLLTSRKARQATLATPTGNLPSHPCLFLKKPAAAPGPFGSWLPRQAEKCHRVPALTRSTVTAPTTTSASPCWEGRVGARSE